jgi:ankyrin repeat protein
MSSPECRNDISKIYLACRNGDVDYVKEYLKNLSSNESANHFESSIKSSLLHTSSYHGHREIVKLLLDHNCDRSLVNAHGITAYEVAANDEIRQLYKRPIDRSNSHRFQDDDTDGCFEIVELSKQSVSIKEIFK